MELSICIFFNVNGKNITNLELSALSNVSNIIVIYNQDIKNKRALLKENIFYKNKRINYSTIAYNSKSSSLDCLSSAYGDYIWFLNEFDILKEGAIETLFQAVKQNKNIDYIYINSFIISQNKNQSKVFIPTVIIKKSNLTTKDIIFFFRDIHYLHIGIWLNSFCNDTVFVIFDSCYVLHNKQERFIYNPRSLYCIYRLAIRLYAYITDKKTLSLFRGNVSLSLINKKKLPLVNLLRDYIHHYYVFYASQRILSGKNIGGLTNFNERYFQKKLIKCSNTKYNTIVLGSSKIEHLSNSDRFFFNHTLSGASLKDFVGIISIYHKNKGYIPKNIIIGIDPWIFNIHSLQYRWRDFKPEVFEFINKNLNNKKIIQETNSYINAGNYSYSSANKYFIKYFSIKDAKVCYTVNSTFINKKDNIKRINGSVEPSLNSQNINNADVVNRAIKSLDSIYSLENFLEMDNICFFEGFIKFIIKQKSNLLFLLPPLHPIVWKEIEKNKKYIQVQNTEKYLRKFSSKQKITLVGSYNPNLIQIKEEDFIDELHLKKDSFLRLFPS